ncbi:MAG TPA: glycosyltransferase family 2 protein [Gemmatimonadaceae bacterium]|nr:glycosyltransferase family 2 protein [Gemmatimonadaceae bacterium]
MTLALLALVALGLAALPCGLFLRNLGVYRPLPRGDSRNAQSISVLIPARNEEQNIRATLEAALGSAGSTFEIIVLDDRSTDRTAAIVSGFARRYARVRLESAPVLPAGWCGKQHACHVLAPLARHPLLVFMDADVRLAPDALARMARFMDQRGVALASGVPRQELGTLSERLLIPLIHFLLLGFLPMRAMRRTRMPALSAGCGQLFIARRDAYFLCGGHAMLRSSLHDGLKLPRAFRRAGFSTDLFDATDIATCRMYHSNADTWRGLGKNATEGLGAPGTIGPMSALLFGGQVLPFVLLAFAPMLTSLNLILAACAAAMAWLPRLIAARKFRQPVGAALLHPLGVVALLTIQWHALARHLAGKPSIWKGREAPLLSNPHPPITRTH